MQRTGRYKKKPSSSPHHRDGRRRKSKSKSQQRQSGKRLEKSRIMRIDSKEKPQKARSSPKSPRKLRHSRSAATSFNLMIDKKLKEQQKSDSRGSKESISSTKKSSSSEASDIEVGTIKKNLKSRAPTTQSINTLTNRVKRRELEMKKRWGLTSSEEEKDGVKTTSKQSDRRKKSDDNYREVFPDVKLNFVPTSQTPPEPSMSMLASTSEQHPNVTMRKSSPNWSTRREDFPSKPLVTETSSPTKDTLKEDGKPPLIFAAEFTPSESLVAESTPQSFAEPREQPCRSPLMPTQFGSPPQTLSFTGLPYVKNKNNRGKLFVNGEPFWVEKISEDITDEENMLNAAVVLEVASGKLSLVNMPDESIVLDMCADWKVLQSRDRKCFSKDVLFGNTVRSMVNLLETSEFEESIKARKALGAKINVLEIIDPTMVVYYMRDDLDYLTEEEFRKRKSTRRGRWK